MCLLTVGSLNRLSRKHEGIQFIVFFKYVSSLVTFGNCDTPRNTVCRSNLIYKDVSIADFYWQSLKWPNILE